MITIRLITYLITCLSRCTQENITIVTENGFAERSREVLKLFSLYNHCKSETHGNVACYCDGGEVCLLNDCVNTRQTNNPNMHTAYKNTQYTNLYNMHDGQRPSDRTDQKEE